MNNFFEYPSIYDDEYMYDSPSDWGFNYLAITHDDMSNGEGLRTVLWVAGCSHACPNCQNAYSWDKNFGSLFTEEIKDDLYLYISKDYTQGVTFSGGDPLFVANREPLGRLAREIKSLYPSKDLWVYTGYELASDPYKGLYFREVAPWKRGTDEFALEWLDLIDVLVDRPYLDEVRKQDVSAGKDPNWRGSSNQRIIDVPASLSAGRVIKKED